MEIGLRCPSCTCSFSAAPDLPADEVLERMTDEGPWYALGEGQTFEDMIFAALLARGRICCPDCREPVVVSEASLAQLALETFPGPFCHET